MRKLTRTNVHQKSMLNSRLGIGINGISFFPEHSLKFIFLTFNFWIRKSDIEDKANKH